jgi:hypothetical protein
MIIKRFIFSLFFCLISLQSIAADLKGVSKIFQDTFWTSHYEERFCGKNIEKLVRMAIDARLDLSGAQILQITDQSGWMFGMVNALQAREGGRLIVPAQTSPERSPGEKNWYFHVVLLVEGKIIDYDFLSQASIYPIKDYMNAMFIPEKRVNDPAYKMSKMKGYKIKAYPAEDYILRQSQRLSVEQIAQESYLKDFLPVFFK